MVLSTERIGSFNPFEMSAFFCPVCGDKEFIELLPYGGVWCRRCNAAFQVNGTCDGLRKICVVCSINHVWWGNLSNESRVFRSARHFWTVIWEGDDKVTWMMRFDDGQLYDVASKEGEIVVTKY